MFVRTVIVEVVLAGSSAVAQEVGPPEVALEVNAARVELGKRWFYDTTLSCATCH
ncbi:MAG: hypothetical protein AB8B62_16160 [Roseobacter sp.]